MLLMGLLLELLNCLRNQKSCLTYIMWDSFFMNKDSVQSIVDEVTNCYLKYYRQEHANSSCT